MFQLLNAFNEKNVGAKTLQMGHILANFLLNLPKFWMTYESNLQINKRGGWNKVRGGGKNNKRMGYVY